MFAVLEHRSVQGWLKSVLQLPETAQIPRQDAAALGQADAALLQGWEVRSRREEDPVMLEQERNFSPHVSPLVRFSSWLHNSIDSLEKLDTSCNPRAGIL